MNKLKTILLSLTIGAFLLPFVPPGCADMTGGKKEAVTDSASVVTDSLKVKTDSLTSNKVLSNEQLTTKDSITTDTSVIEKKNFLLYPDNENLSGIGYLFVYFTKEYFFTFFGLLFLFVALIEIVFKLKIFTFDIIWLLSTGQLFLIILAVLKWDVLMWGFWVLTGLYLMTTALFILTKRK